MLTTDRHLVRLLDGPTMLQALPTFTELTFTQEDMGTGAWTVATPFSGQEHVLGEWLASALPGLMVWSPDSDHRAVGYLTDHTIIETSGGLALRAGGLDWMGYLNNRLIWPQFNLDVNEFWRYQTHTVNGTLPEVAWRFASQVVEALNYAATGGPRMLPVPATLDPATFTGTAVEVTTEALPTLQRVRELIAGTGHTLRLIPEADDQAIAARFVLGERPKARTPLSVSEEHLGSVATTRRAATATRVIGVGAEVAGGPQREVADVTNLTPADWQRTYVERFVNEPTLSGADLLAACQRELAAGGPTRSVVATDPRPGLWGSDLDIGWLADIAATDNRGQSEYIEVPVLASTLLADERGQTRTIEFGSLQRTELSGVLAAIGDLQQQLERTNRRV